MGFPEDTAIETKAIICSPDDLPSVERDIRESKRSTPEAKPHPAIDLRNVEEAIPHRDLEGLDPQDQEPRYVHPAIGKEYFVFWRRKTESFWGFYHPTREQAEAFLLAQIPESHRDQFEILKVKVIGQ